MEFPYTQIGELESRIAECRAMLVKTTEKERRVRDKRRSAELTIVALDRKLKALKDAQLTAKEPTRDLGGVWVAYFVKHYTGAHPYYFSAIRPDGQMTWAVTGNETRNLTWAQLMLLIKKDERDPERAMRSLRIGKPHDFNAALIN